MKDIYKKIVKVKSTFYREPNGPSVSTCPLCESIEFNFSHLDMDNIKHKQGCIYLVAKKEL